MAGAMGKRDRHKNRLGPFVPLLTATLDSPAWLALSHGAKFLYVALKRRVPNGRNRAYISYRHAEAEIRSSPRKIGTWFRELKYYGFIVLVEHGYLGLDGKGKSPHWRLTELGATSKASADGLFEPPTRDFLSWNGVPFQRPGDRRTPGAFGCQKQNPASDGGYTPLPTGEAVVLPTGDTPKTQSASDGVCIATDKTASDGVGITSLTTPCPSTRSLPIEAANSNRVDLDDLDNIPAAFDRRKRKLAVPANDAEDPRIASLSNWGRAGKV
jgi:hypothetical protein